MSRGLGSGAGAGVACGLAEGGLQRQNRVGGANAGAGSCCTRRDAPQVALNLPTFPAPPSPLAAADEYRLRQAEERRAASQRATERALSKSKRGSSDSAATPSLSLNATSYQPRLPNLDRLRDALGLRRDHLAAAAAKVDAAEGAGAPAAATTPPAAAQATSPRRSSSGGGAEPKRSFTTFGSEGKRPGSGDTAGSEAPLTSVVVRPQGGPPPAAAPAAAPAGPSWALRDPGHVAPKSSGVFGGFFSRKA